MTNVVEEVNPDEDCGSVRCSYACENCPFGIPEKVDGDPTSIRT